MENNLEERFENIRKYIKRKYNSRIYKEKNSFGINEFNNRGGYDLDLDQIERYAISICEFIEDNYDVYTEYEIGGQFLVKITFE